MTGRRVDPRVTSRPVFSKKLGRRSRSGERGGGSLTNSWQTSPVPSTGNEYIGRVHSTTGNESLSHDPNTDDRCPSHLEEPRYRMTRGFVDSRTDGL